jgi:hypothetical protein
MTHTEWNSISMELKARYELRPMYLPCGGTAYFDVDSGISYRCDTCNAVVGSIGMPGSCKDEAQKYDNWEKLGGKGWNYDTGTTK